MAKKTGTFLVLVIILVALGIAYYVMQKPKTENFEQNYRQLTGSSVIPHYIYQREQVSGDVNTCKNACNAKPECMGFNTFMSGVGPYCNLLNVNPANSEIACKPDTVYTGYVKVPALKKLANSCARQ